MPSVPFADLVREFQQTRAIDSFTAPAALVHHTGVRAQDTTGDGDAGPREPPQRASLSALVVRDLGMVHSVIKGDDKAFEHVGIGRAPTGDVILPLPEVSLYHAYIFRGSGGSFLLADANSLHGTRIGLHLLAPRCPTFLSNGARVCFGRHQFTFLTANGLLKFARRFQIGQ